MNQPIARSNLIVHRIAETLGVPFETFVQAADHPEADPMESTNLLRAFLQISDPEVRRECLAFVEAAASSALQKP